MLMSRKRANSFWLVDPHPSTMLNAMDSAARIKAEALTPPNLMQSIGVTDERAAVSQ